MLTFPLAFPGWSSAHDHSPRRRQGLIGDITEFAVQRKAVLAYSMAGLFLGCLYFSIPRTITTIMASAEKIDRSLEEAASFPWGLPLARDEDVLIPALVPGLISSGRSASPLHGRIWTAFTLATNIDVFPS